MILDLALLVICAGFWYTGYQMWQMRDEFSQALPLALMCAFFSFLAFWSLLDWFLLAFSLFCLFTLVMLS